MADQFDSIMDRIRARQTEMSGGEEPTEETKENDVQTRKISVKQEAPSSNRAFGLSAKSNDVSENGTPTTPSVFFRQPPPKESTPSSQDAESSVNNANASQQSSSTKKSNRFSMMAEELDNFEFDYQSQYNKPKEFYMKGRSPRMSIGETRPSVLCAPGGAAALKSPNVAKSSKSAPEVITNGPETAIGRHDFEKKRAAFASPPQVQIHQLPNESSCFSGGSSVNDMSTVLGGSAEMMMNLTTSSLSCGEMSMNQHVTRENTMINAQSCENRDAILHVMEENVSNAEYGAHTFMRKKVPKDAATSSSSTASAISATSTSSTPSLPYNGQPPPPVSSVKSSIFTSTNIHTFVSSPKPFSSNIGRNSNSVFSPVHFTPKSTSSPKASVSVPSENISPSKSAALEASVATTRRKVFEEMMKSNNGTTNSNAPAPIATPRHHVSSSSSSSKPMVSSNLNTPHYYPQSTGKKQSSHPFQSIGHPVYHTSSSPQPPRASAPAAPTPPMVSTQFRGQTNTPIVQGARADEKTAGNAPPVGAGLGKLKSLKSRWEFSSATGTPIHPDATEDSLIATAIKMKESAIPNRIGYHPTGSRKGPSASSIYSQNKAINGRGGQYDEYEEGGGEYQDDEDDVFEEEENYEDVGDDYVANVGDVECADASRIIDNAFGSIEGWLGTETPSPFRDASPVKTLRQQKTEIIEEEENDDDVVTCEEDPEDPEDVTEVQSDPRGYHEEREDIDELPVYRKNDSHLAYSVSFYRRLQRDRVGESSGAPPSSVSPSAPIATSSLTSPQKLKQLVSLSTGSGGSNNPGHVIESESDAIKRLRETMTIENELVTQSKRALEQARGIPTFRGSREEIEAQRAVLVHVEKYRAVATELERLKRDGAKIIDGPRGTISIQQLTVTIDRKYVAAHIASAKKSEEVFYFMAILRYGEQVDVSKMVTSDGGLNRRGALEFPVPLMLTAIPADFRAVVEIYGQRSMRESTTHEDKFKLKSSTLKPKGRSTFLGGGGTTSSSANRSLYTPSTTANNQLKNDTFGGIGGVTGPAAAAGAFTNFQCLGQFSFDINCPGKYDYQLSDAVFPLAGVVQMKVKKQAVDGADILYRGFLSMYQRTNEGLGSWTRYWSVLENGEMKFWRQPEDEGIKPYLVLMDLSTCCRSEGASTVNDICPFPNSFHIDVWAPKDDPDEPRGGIMKLRVMLAADTNQDLLKWLSVINCTSRQLCTWRNPIH